MNRQNKHRFKKNSALDKKIAKCLVLRIESCAFGGDGVARFEGKVYFVAGALPGQLVEIEVTEDKKSYARGRVVQIIEQADYLQAVDCIYAAKCGGCQWQAVPYPEQLAWKTRFVQDALQRIGIISAESYPFSMHSGQQSLFYRNRIEVKFHIVQGGGVEIGYFESNTHRLVSIASCSIADKTINKYLALFKQIQFTTHEHTYMTSVQLQVVDSDGPKLLISSHEDKHGFFWCELIEQIQLIPELRDNVIWDHSSYVLLEQWQGLDFYTKAGQFQQVNMDMNQFLRQWVRNLAQQYGIKTAIDLYCGSGNLSLALAADGVDVMGIESYAPSIETALFNVQKNNLQHRAHYKVGDAQQIRALYPAIAAVDLLLVDPPRRGLQDAINSIIEIAADRLVYVSCDPNTLARDLKIMMDGRYTLELVMGLDFFPQSYHVETVCLLKKC